MFGLVQAARSDTDPEDQDTSDPDPEPETTTVLGPVQRFPILPYIQR